MSSVRDIWVIDRGSDDYPDCLCDLDRDERPRLHGIGRRAAISELDHLATVTIVGTRRPSGYGLRVAEELAGDLALAGVTVVSGLARGIDAAAHRGALAGGGTTIAVLANGPDVVYPPVNRPLYERIIESGAVISEHPAGVGARRHFFPERNRIMAALGSVIAIIEAAQPSGTMITVDRALRLGRTVGAVPGQLGVRVAAGTNDLIRDGAHLLRDARDVLDLLYGVGADTSPLLEAPKPRRGPPLEPPLDSILDRVRSGAATVDRIALDAALEPREAAVGLARLELLGYVSADALGGYSATSLAPP